MKVFVLGAGTWGTALSGVLIENNHNIILWHLDKGIVNSMINTRIHPNLENYLIPSEIEITNSLDKISECEVLLITVPSQFVRSVLRKIPPLQKDTLIVFGSKGIENQSLMTMSDVVKDVLDINDKKIVALSGPSHAEEVITSLPTAVVSASTCIESARQVQILFNTSGFRVYSSDDIIGVQLGGAIKNIIAIAAGICDGIGYGHNTMAALITRGLAEITRLGISLGGRKDTFFGLSGLGDLVVTAGSKLSRNRFVGENIGKGKSLNEILGNMDMVAEGVKTAQSVHDLIQKTGIEMPISEQIYQVLFHDKDPKSAIIELMTRIPIEEKI